MALHPLALRSLLAVVPERRQYRVIHEIAVDIVREIDRHAQSGKLKLIESRA